jgi:putative glycosyltransferase (TIGR04372 family)
MLRPIILIRFGLLNARRIGHYAANTENYLCERDMGKYPSNAFDLFGFGSFPVCNNFLTKLWKRNLIIVPGIIINILHWANDRIPFGKVHNIELPLDHEIYYGCDTIKPHAVLNAEEERKGKEYLKSKGLKENDKFICFFARDSRYMDTLYHYQSKEELSYNNYRNADISTYKQAIDYLTQDYYAFRVGSVTKKIYSYGNENVIEYSNNGDRCDFLDIYLPARCSLFIESGTSFRAIPQIFKTPIVSLNYVPFSWSHTNTCVNFLPKKLWSKKDKRFLSFREMLSFKLDDFPYILQQEEIECVDNTPEEIKDVVMEAIMRVNGTWQESEEDILLQQKFQSIFPPDMYDVKYRNLIGAKFLKQNIQLLD